MKQLKCEMCGGTDLIKQDGVFVCQNCGCKYSVEEAKKLMFEVTNNINIENLNIQNENNIDGLLMLAKRELSAKYYGSKDLYKYLDEIVIKFPEGPQRIKELFDEMGLYKIAEDTKQGFSSEGHDIANLLTKYDSENIIGWLLAWKMDFVMERIPAGENIIRLAQGSEKEKYEKEVYSYFANHGPQCGAYKKYLDAIPRTYINNNVFIQDILIKYANRCTYIKTLLPANRLHEVQKPEPQQASSGGCYVATCVYGSYDCPQVWTLRRFRDNTLAETMLGRAFIRTYYAISPTLVKWLGDTSWFKKMWKGTLDRMVSKLQSNGVEDTPYQDRNW